MIDKWLKLLSSLVKYKHGEDLVDFHTSAVARHELRDFESSRLVIQANYAPAVTPTATTLTKQSSKNLTIVSVSNFEEYLSFGKKHRSTSEPLHALLVEAVILPTIPYNNNANGNQVYFHRDNKVIRSFVSSFVPRADGLGVQTVLLMDWEGYTDELIIENGRLMGISPDHVFDVQLDTAYKSLAAMVCPGLGGATPIHMAPTCGTKPSAFHKPILSYDGMHWAGTFIQARSTAALLCLMQCAYQSRQEKTRDCQDTCNSNYMSLRPIDQRSMVSSHFLQ